MYNILYNIYIICTWGAVKSAEIIPTKPDRANTRGGKMHKQTCFLRLAQKARRFLFIVHK